MSTSPEAAGRVAATSALSDPVRHDQGDQRGLGTRQVAGARCPVSKRCVGLGHPGGRPARPAPISPTPAACAGTGTLLQTDERIQSSTCRCLPARVTNRQQRSRDDLAPVFGVEPDGAPRDIRSAGRSDEGSPYYFSTPRYMMSCRPPSFISALGSSANARGWRETADCAGSWASPARRPPRT